MGFSIKTSSARAEEKLPREVRVSGATVQGRFCTLLARKEGFEIHIMPLVWMILALFVAASAIFVLCLFLGIPLLGMLFTIIGGLLAYFGVLMLYPGRMMKQCSYGEIYSFVTDDPEMALNLQNGEFIALRLSQKKQTRLLQGLLIMLEQNGEYHFERTGQYFRIKPNREPEAEPAPVPGTPPKSKKAIAAAKAREEAKKAAQQENPEAQS